MSVADFNVIKYKNGSFNSLSDKIVREEPLVIFINGEKKYFCMRMPGLDYELAIGLLYNEGVIDSITDIDSCEQTEENILFTIKGKIVEGEKKIYASSGSMVSDELVTPRSRSEGSITADRMFVLQKEFFLMQKIFNETGAVHASAFYASDGNLISFAEDVGRHNALDKCTGSAIISGMKDKIFLIMLSSRISFEMIRKSFRTGAVMVAGVSAPTSGAVVAADRSDMTLIGFLRGERFNIYTHDKRVLNNTP